MHPAKSTPAIAQVRSRERDAEVTQLKNQVAFLTEKVNGYENFEEQVTQLMQLVQNQQNHSLEASRGGFSLDYQSPTPIDRRLHLIKKLAYSSTCSVLRTS
nr:hypothetical protein CFP56_73262 [Quercus suber]